MRLSTKNLGRRSMMLVALVFMTLSAVAADLNWTFTFAPADINLSASGQYTVITLADGSNPRDAVGAPAIPAKFANILLPSGATDVTVSATGDLVLLASDVTPWPTQRVAPKSKKQPPFAEPDPVAYASANPWPAVAATYEGLHEMQGSTFVSVRVNPLVYVASEKTLYYRPQVTVTVSYNEPDAQRNNMRTRLGATAMVNALVVNPSTADAALRSPSLVPASDQVDYLIVTSNSLKTAFQALADYRATGIGGGYKTLVVAKEDISSNYSGDDIQDKIRNCIKDYYQNHGTKFVVLGGDDTIVPDRDTYAKVDDDVESHMPTDLYYSDLDGTWTTDGSTYGKTGANVDMSPEVIVGRIPVRTASQLSGYIAKVQTFEADLTHTRNSIIMGGPSAWNTYKGDNRPSDDVTGDGHAGFRAGNHSTVSDSEMWLRRLYRDGIKKYWDNAEQATGRTINLACDYITSWDGSTCGDKPLNATNMKKWLNNGYTHMMFSGHGYPQGWGLESGEYSTDEAASQTNLTAFVYTDACLTGAFDQTDEYGNISYDIYTDPSEPCLGEAFIRNPKGGSLVHMGCARYGWGTPDEGAASNNSDGGPSTVYAYKFYERLYEQDAVAENRTVGEAFAMSKVDMISQCNSYGCERWIQFGLNYLGDPAIALYPRSTDPMISVTPKSVDFGNRNTLDQAYNKTLSVKGLNLEGNVTVTLSDENGVYSLSQTSITQSDAATGVNITVTFQSANTGTYAGSITFSSEGAESVVVPLTATAIVALLMYEGCSGYTSASDGTYALDVDSENLDYDNWSEFTKVYSGGTTNAKENGGCLKLGTSKYSGSMTTGNIALTGAGTLTFYLKQYGTDSGKLNVTVTGAKADVTEFTPSSDWTLCTVNLTEATGTITIKLATSTYRAYVDEITLTGDGGTTPVTPDDPDEPFVGSGKYAKVTDASTLAEGDKILIAYDAGVKTYVLSTNQAANYRTATDDVTINDDGTLTPGTATQIITLEKSNNKYLFNVEGGYLYAASSSKNYLRTEEEADDNAKATISISDGDATIIFQGTNTRNELRYNPNNGIPIFSCYASTSYLSKPQIYRELPVATLALTLTDDGTDNASVITANNGKKAKVTLAGRTFYKDGEWNTICLPFDLQLAGSPLADAEAKMLTTATMTGTHVSLHFGPAQGTLEAGVPYIIRWTTGGDNIVEPTFTGVTINGVTHPVSSANGNVQFTGYYDAFGITADDTDIYYMGTGSTLKHTAKPRTLKACRAYFRFTPALSRDISIDFGEGEAKPTGVGAALMNSEERIMNNEVYDLQGRRVDGSRFTVNGSRLNRGIYIKNGRKVVVK